MIRKVKTNEGIEYKKLSPEEMKARHILGQLVGPCADFINPTRNGRKYSEQLWENVFNDPIMQEKIQNGVCFGELGHPADRTETDPEKIAICLRQQPVKNNDGKLIAVFDILDTPNGKILQTLCEYGSIIGVSSRGQGDLIEDADGNESVDCDTYDCQGWDAVLVPAVKTARMKYVKESLEYIPSDGGLKKALCESLKEASQEDKKIMEETLNSLHINLVEDDKEDQVAPEEEVAEEEVTETTAEEKVAEPVADADEESIEIEVDEVPEEVTLEGAVEEEIPEEEKKEETEDSTEVIDAVNSWVAQWNENHDEALPEMSEEDIQALAKVVAGALEVPEVEEQTEEEKEIEEIENAEEAILDDEQVSSDEESAEIDSEDVAEEEAEETAEEAEDNGEDAIVDSLKEVLKAKTELEEQVKQLQKQLAVSDTKVNEGLGECEKYKGAVARLATIAKNSKGLNEKISSLTEDLKEKETLVESQQQKITRLVKARKATVEDINSLTEQLNAATGENEELKNQVKTLNEQLSVKNQEVEAKATDLTESLKKVQKTENLQESLSKATALKESYKKLATKAVNKYIESQATMLGLATSDIKRKLGETYTIEDVDQVCEDLKSYQLNISKLPFSVGNKVGVRINEGGTDKKLVGNKPRFEDDDVDEGLIKLAKL